MATRLTYRILGPLELRTAAAHDGGWQRVTGARAIVLAMLLVNAGATVKNTRLVQALWPDPPTTAAAQVHKHMTTLRKLLHGAGRDQALVNEPDVGYRLLVADGELDSWEFRRLVQAADRHAGAAEADSAFADLRAALSLWRDRRALVGLQCRLLEDAVESLSHRRLRAAEQLFALALERHDDELILDLAPRFADPTPTQERLWAAWVIALYRTERRAQASATCQAFDELDHLGHNPLRELCYAVGRDDADAVEAYAHRLLPRRLAASEPLPLAAEVPDFTGRHDLVVQLCRLLSEPSAAPGPVVLTGPTGAGKTALAIRVAHRLRRQFPGGVRYLELRGSQPQPAGTEEALARLLRSLGVAAREIPADWAARAALYRRRLTDQRMLLVLDDVADAASLRDLVPSDPAVATLVTSQDRLDSLPSARRVPLPELPLDDGVAFFRRVATDGGADLADDDPIAIRRMVDDVCGRLPLAIRVAGALRAAYGRLSTSELVALAGDAGLDTLVYQHLDVPAALAASYQKLDGPARTLLRRLSLLDVPDFAGWMAAALLDTAPATAAQVLDRLASRSLLQGQRPTGPTPPRYRLPDLIRRYARGLAAQQEDIDAVLGRGYGALLGLAEQAHQRMFGGPFEIVHSDALRWRLPESQQDSLLDDPVGWYEQERLGLRAAVGHAAQRGLAALSWDLAISSHEFYAQRSWLDDWFDTHTRARRACRKAGDTRGEAAMVTALGQPTLVNTGRSGLPGPTDLVRAAECFRAAGDRHGEAIARRTLGSAYRRTGAFVAARQELTRARAGYQGCGDTFGAWQSTRLLGQTYLDLGDPQAALPHLTEAYELARSLGHTRALPQSDYWIGQALLGRGDQAAAEHRFRRALAAATRASDETGKAYCRYGLGVAAHRAGRVTEAVRLLTDSRIAAHLAGDGVLEGRILMSLGEAHRGQDPAATADYLAQAADRFEDCHAPWLRDRALRRLEEIQRLG